LAVKLIMSWDILPGREQEYFEFVVREWVPGIQRLGLEPTYGNHPQIIAGAQISNKPDLDNLLDSTEWLALTERLLNFVTDFSFKVVPARRGFQM
jgi:hypothetical protein